MKFGLSFNGMESKIVVTVYNGLEAFFFSLSLLLLVPSMKLNIYFFLYLIIFSEGVLGRKSIPPGNHNGCFFTTFSV